MFNPQTQIPRSPLASTLTVVFHLCLLGILILISTAMPNIPKRVVHESLTFVMTELPSLEFEAPPPEPTPRLEMPRPEPPKPVEIPVIETPAPPPPKPVERRVIEEPKPVPVPPKPPAVVVGAFADAATAKKPERSAEVAVAGFEAAAAEAARARKQLATVDGFATNLPATAKPTRTAIVGESGFGTSSAPNAPARQAARASGPSGFATDPSPTAAPQAPRTTAVAGFGTDPTAKPAPAPRAATPTQSAGFTETSAPKPPPQRAEPKPQADRPVEVLSKPTPAYTEEARAQRIEGEVLLEVEFAADGQIRVLRVVRGLGYGLDEMAQRAAERIRFRPATSRGVPVDFRATLTILFRLT
jgi:TonB family protein